MLERDVLRASRSHNKNARSQVMMRLWQRIAAITFLGLASSANAGVIYRWHDLEASPATGASHGYIEIDPAYWSPGGSLRVPQTGPFQPFFGVWAIEYGFTNPDPGPPGSVFLDASFSCYDGPVLKEWCDSKSVTSYDTPMFGHGGVQLDLTFGATLSGRIYANDTETSVEMAGDLVWTIRSFASDFIDPCTRQGVCHGGTGLWILDLSTVPVAVSEPGFKLAFSLVLVLSSVAIRKRTMNRQI